MENIFCKACGGDMSRVGNYNVCRFCGSKWIIDASNDVHAVDRANAWAALRDSDFEHAVELFENILIKEKESHEAYWGMALAMHGIIYVTDLDEHKKVPTCNNISESSFLKDKYVQKAISYAPADLAATYKKQSEDIERIRIEWLEKARKEPPYDVFISFKDSDRERGIERTQDSYDAQDLYNALVAEGYKVFFSRISLKDKVSEHYEPYIYNAIRTAKVMIVFGEKAEYFNSVWIRNEWTRFKTRIEKGEKHKNSLVVVYKNMDPGDLPVVLKSRQCLNASDMTFLQGLSRHIKRVVSESAQMAHLDRIEIKGGQIAKKASRIANESIQVREIGEGAIAQTSVSEKQLLDLVKSYVKSGQWSDAEKIAEDITFNNPSFAEAIMYKLLIKYKLKSEGELLKVIDRFSSEDYNTLENILNCADKEYAASVLDLMYQANGIDSEQVMLRILKVILPFNYSNRAKRIKELFEMAISKERLQVFETLLTTLDSSDVDLYVDYNLRFAKKTDIMETRIRCLDRVIAVDEGNIQAIRFRFDMVLPYARFDELRDTFESLLRYTSDPNQEVLDTLKGILKMTLNEEICAFAKQALKYYSGNLENIKDIMIDIANCMIGCGYFDNAQYFMNLVLSIDQSCADAYWGICLIKTQSTSEKNIKNSKIPIKLLPEYTKYLTMVGEERRQQCIALAKKQESAITAKKSAKKARMITVAIAAVVAVLLALAGVYIFVIDPKLKYDSAMKLLDEERYEEAADVLLSLGIYKDSDTKLVLARALDELGGDNYEEFVRKAAEYGVSLDLVYDTDGGALDGESANEFTYDSFNVFVEFKRAEKTDYQFVGWEYVGSSYVVGEEKVIVNLKAVYSDGYLIEYDLAGGVGDNPSEYHKDGASVTITPPTRKGYTFVGWTGTDLDTPTVELTIESGSHGNKKYTANWVANSYTVTYNADGGAVSVGTQNVTFDSVTELAKAQKVGYIFGGWYCDSVRYEDGVWATDRDVTLTAKWLSNTNTPYTVNHYLQDKDSEDKYTLGATEALNGVTDTKVTPGVKTYAGFTAPAAKTVTIAPDGSLVVDYYYTRNSYKVTFVTNGGSSIDSIYLKFDTVISVEAPTREGYTFGGWFADESLTSGIVSVPSSDVTLYAYWEEEDKPSAFSYSGTTTITITAYNGNETTVKLPSHIGGLPVTAIDAYAFKDHTDIVSVIVPDTVTSIGVGAFSGCSGLTSITLPFIGGSATADEASSSTLFGYVFGTSSYTGGISTRQDYSSNQYATYYIPSSLKSVTITGGQLFYGAFYGCEDLSAVSILGGVTSVGSNAFCYCTALETVSLPVGVTDIGKSAFYKCVNLAELTVPDGATTIGSYAFYECSRLTSVTMPVGLLSVGDHAFYGCSGLTSVTVPATVTSIGSYAFSGCSGLTEITLPFVGGSAGATAPSSSTVFGYIFGGSSYEGGTSVSQRYSSGSSSKYYIPTKLKSVTITGGDLLYGAFCGCGNLSAITLPDSITSIADYAFYECKGITELAIPAGVTSVGGYAFYKCSALTSLVLPTGVTSIGDYAFYECGSMTSVNIPDNVTTIGNYAFHSCGSLTSIAIPNGVTSIGNYAFYKCIGLTSITVPGSVKTIGSAAFGGCSNLASMTLPFVGGSATATGASSTTLFGYIFGTSTYDHDYKARQYYGSTSSSSYYLPSKLKSVTITGGNIFYGAFYGCYELVSITIPDNLTAIGDYAFYGCASLSAITIPSGVTTIGNYIFYECNSLASVNIPNGVTSIGNYAFYSCTALSSINIPNGVKTIGSYAFCECSFTTVVVPDSVTTIGNRAFHMCESLTSMTLPFVGNTLDGTNYGNLGWIFDDSSYSHQGDDIPATLKTIVVTGGTRISEGAFYGCSNVTSITLPDGITSIGASAFYNCSGLSSITIPDGVTSIGNNAFYGCSGITSIVVPDSVTSIGSAAFSGCSGLTSITLPFVGGSVSESGAKASTLFGYIFGTASYNGATETSQYYASGSSSSKYYIPSGLTSVTVTGGDLFYGAFYNCNGLTSITLPDSVTSIGDYAFYKCDSLTSISIPDGVTSIGSSAFLGCSGLSSVTIPDGVTSIGSSAFRKCSGLSSVTIPDSVTSIGSNAFSECSSLSSVTILEGVTSIEDNTFYKCSSLTSITIPSSVTSIGSYAFYGCSSLTSITIPSSVTSIGSYAFYDCSSLTSITIPSSVTSIGSYAFYECSGLSSITIPNGVTSIAENTFRGCSGLTSVVIPNSVTSIGTYAFYGCSGLTSIVVPNSVTSIGAFAFSGCSGLTSITLPFVGGSATATSAGSSTLFGYIFGTTSYDGATKTAQKCSFSSSSSSYSYYIPSNLRSVTITGVNPLTGAFSGCSGLTSVTLSGNVTSIGEHVFDGCSGLTSINIQSGVTSIGNYAFNGCSGLTSITIPSSVTSIGSYAFNGCSGLTSINIQSGVTSIGSYAFNGCSGLTSVVVPNSVTSIGGSAFSGCSGLTSITLPFVGSSKTESSSASLFGYIFGKTSYTGGIDTRQYYSSNSSSIYCIPEKLSSVTVNGGKISYGAFYGCSRLISITLPDSITAIGEKAFYGCGGLVSITIPAGVTSIEKDAFTDCFKLVEVWNLSTLSIVKGGTTHGNAGYYALNVYYTTQDKSKTFVTNDGFVFYVDGDTRYLIGYAGDKTSITLPANCNGKSYSIYKSAFRGCTALVSVTIPDGITAIPDEAFYGCSRLNAVAISNSVTSIGSYAFYKCSSLTDITIPKNVVSIGEYAFAECSAIVRINSSTDGELNLPEKVATIGDYAFMKLGLITKVKLPNSVTSIGLGAFNGCNAIEDITLPFVGKSADATYYDAVFGYIFGYETLTTTSSSYGYSTVLSNEYYNTQYSSINGVIWQYACLSYYYSGSRYYNTSYFYYIPTTIKKVTLTSQTAIPVAAFNNCNFIETITLPSGVVSIGSYAFASCWRLTSLAIPGSVTSIDAFAFDSCNSLAAVTFGNANGWWYAPAGSDTSGVGIPAGEVSNASTVAEYLTSSFCDKFWKRT